MDIVDGTCISLEHSGGKLRFPDFRLPRVRSGKSTVGKLVASALKYPFLDSDTLIEQLAGCTIADIFRDEGEESFRDLESQVLQVGMHTTLKLPAQKWRLFRRQHCMTAGVPNCPRQNDAPASRESLLRSSVCCSCNCEVESSTSESEVHFGSCCVACCCLIWAPSVQELMPFKAVVVSTGGGAVVRRQNWGFMQHGVVVWLTGSPELLGRRALHDGTATRPLLSRGNGSQAQNAVSRPVLYAALWSYLLRGSK